MKQIYINDTFAEFLSQIVVLVVLISVNMHGMMKKVWRSTRSGGI